MVKAVQTMSRLEAQRLEGLFFDLDDTLLHEGKLRKHAYAALFHLAQSGLRLMTLTGRPARWAELIARMWPVEAAIAENGALGFAQVGRRVSGFDFLKTEVRLRHRTRLERLVMEARRQIPELSPADDATARVSDFTFDIGEFEQADESTIARARQLARERGARTTRSSVHLHFTFDRADKATGALRYLGLTGVDVTRARARFAFIGDSQNDAECFSGFATTVGVSNLRGRFSVGPRYLTRGATDDGFCEFADVLCTLRAGRAGFAAGPFFR